MAIKVLQLDNNGAITASVLAINFVCAIRVGYITHSLTHSCNALAFGSSIN